MTNDEIVKWLRSKKVETESLLCLGCDHEHMMLIQHRNSLRTREIKKEGN